MGGAAAATMNKELGFLCWRFSESAGFGKRRMRLSGSSRSELQVPAITSYYLWYIEEENNGQIVLG